jgi:hypothetical protein
VSKVEIGVSGASRRAIVGVVSFRRHRVLPVRPYAPSIRARVFALLRSLGLEVDEGGSIPARTRDDEVMSRLRGLSPSVLLVPFHAHRDDRGEPVNGLGILVRLREIEHLASVPVVMPVSGVGEAAFELLRSRGGPELDSVLTRTFLLRTSELDGPELGSRLEVHLARFLGPPAR